MIASAYPRPGEAAGAMKGKNMDVNVEINLPIHENGTSDVEITSELPAAAEDELRNVVDEWWADRGAFFIDRVTIRQEAADSRDDEAIHRIWENGT